MGTDIHPYVEVKVAGGAWKPASITLSRDRNYTSFAILANVRNGFGFAGVKTHEPLRPISEPRGLPHDTSIKNTDDNYDAPGHVWLGYHDFSYLTLAELKSYPLDQTILETGVVSGEQRALVTAGLAPISWCGAKSPMTADDEQMTWERPLHAAAYLLVKWINELEAFARDNMYEDQYVRVVFGFDS